MTLIKSHELAEMLGLSRSTVQTYAKRGQWDMIPPPIRLGHQFRWNVEGVVIPWLEARQLRNQGETKPEYYRNRNTSKAQH